MKIRNGFVSNSSSSSFIMIGVDSKLTSKPTPLRSESGIESLFISEYGDVEEVTGFILTDTDEYLTDNVLSIQEINRKTEELSLKLEVKFEDIKLYYGTRPA